MDMNAIKVIDVVRRSWIATTDAALMRFSLHKENPAKLLNRNISVAREQQNNIYSTELEGHQLQEEIDLLSLP